MYIDYNKLIKNVEAVRVDPHRITCPTDRCLLYKAAFWTTRSCSAHVVGMRGNLVRGKGNLFRAIIPSRVRRQPRAGNSQEGTTHLRDWRDARRPVRVDVPCAGCRDITGRPHSAHVVRRHSRRVGRHDQLPAGERRPCWSCSLRPQPRSTDVSPRTKT